MLRHEQLRGEMGGVRLFAHNRVRPPVERYRTAKSAAKWLGPRFARTRESIATYVPVVIRPISLELTVAVTAHCNLPCRACRYGRDFTVGQRTLAAMLQVLADARLGGIATARFYGGEPLFHPIWRKSLATRQPWGCEPVAIQMGHIPEKR
jgi:hypothetical protein